VCGATNNRQFRRLVELLGCPEVAEDERFESNDQRVKNRDDLKVILDGCFIKNTTQAWLAALEGSGMPYGPINSIEDSFKHPQATGRGMVDAVELEASVNKQFRVVGVPVKFGDTKPSIRRRPPLLGEHTEEILIEEGIAREKIKWLKKCSII
jgi:succinate--hydroxymethylglutarate CoA-transferase